MRTENYHTCAHGDRNLKSDYITREGLQPYESLGWLNGERLLIDLPAGVIPVDSLTYRIQPHPCFLRFIDCTVPTVRGPLRVQITTEGNKKKILIGHPAGIRVIPEVPDSWEKICIG